MISRRDQLAAALARVEDRIAAACAHAGRPRSQVTLVVVTKQFPASDVVLLHELGIHDVGENRDQEAAEKFADLPGRGGLRLHFVGQVQSRKAGHVASYADVVHSADRLKVIAALDRGAAAADRRLSVLVQVALDEAPGRGGAALGDAGRLADATAQAESLDLRGVMAVAPLDGDPAAAFGRLRQVADGIRSAHPDAGWISAGMSADLEAAVVAGATHLRVGTAILGSRASHG